MVGFHGSFLFRPISAKIENSTSNILDFIFCFSDLESNNLLEEEDEEEEEITNPS